MATTDRAAAVVIAGRIAGHTSSMAGLVEAYAASEALACTAQHLANKLTSIRQCLAAQDIRSAWEITPAAVEGFMAHLAATGRAPGTIVNKRVFLSQFCDFLVKRGELETNPVASTKPPRILHEEPVYLTRGEMATALEAAGWYCLWQVHFAVYTGLRVGEIARLVWGDIRQGRDGPILVVRRSKSDRPRAVPVVPKLQAVIDAMPRGADNEHIFGDHSRIWWTRLLAPVKAAVPKMARPGGGWHDFRRTVGSLLVQDGADIYRVSKILGHANVSTTARWYAHLDAESGRKDLGRL